MYCSKSLAILLLAYVSVLQSYVMKVTLLQKNYNFALNNNFVDRPSDSKTNSSRGPKFNPFIKTSRQNNKSQNMKPFSNIKSRHGDKKEELINDLLDSVKITEQERLQKVLARAGVASRRQSEKLILDGRVVVNGVIVNELGTKVNALKDIITVDGKKISLPNSKEIYWIMVHKPRDTLSTISDISNRNNLGTIVPKANELRLVPLRGLDRDSTGLILLTNDIGWIHPLTHPSFRHKTRYNIVVRGSMSDESLELIRLGLNLVEINKKLTPAQIAVLDVDKPNNLTLIDITLEETVPNQLDLMMQTINCEIVSIKRLEFGPLKLKGLKRGMWKELSLTEIQQLKDSCKNAIKNIAN